MKQKRILNIQGTILDKYQLDLYLEKIASDHILQNKSDKETYPINRLDENYFVIKEVYKLLNEHIKLEIPIHPAGEWILDNLYIIEETVKNLTKELSMKKYTNFLGLANGKYAGFARIYVLASEMVAYTDGNINSKNLEEMIKAYQNKKSLSMDEIWNIGIFLQIALIENIRQICEKIYFSQMQKFRVENIIERTIEKKDRPKFRENLYIRPHSEFVNNGQIKYTFIEYMSYKLKKYGKQAYPYLKTLENEVNKAGTTVDDIIKKEHFDVAVRKVSIGNSITSLKSIARINFLEIFERINGVEDILKQDPAKQYEKMDAKTKIFYRNTIKEISKKTKLSEIYIANKCLEMSERKSINDVQNESEIIQPKEAHVGYYLISEGKTELLNTLLERNNKKINNTQRVNIYIYAIWISTVVLDILISIAFYKKFKLLGYNLFTNIFMALVTFSSIILPIENIVTKTIQYILSKCVKPKLIPKLDFQNGIPEEYATMVVIPTILKNKEQVKDLMKKLEVFYIANKSENIYFTLLGDCSSGQNEIEEFDNEVIETGIEEVRRLNKKYFDIKFEKFNFIYRKRIWNEKEECYLGWERKRGALNQFNEYILGNLQNPFRINTIENQDHTIPKIKYVITLDSDTNLTLNSGLELIGTMAHILNKPILNDKKDLVISGHGIIAPRVGISLENAQKSLFTMIYASQGGTDSYTNAISDMYQDNFDEGIFAGKGIYDLEIFETVLNDELKENTVLSHDLLEGCYLRSGFASDIVIMDGYPTNYISAKKRLYRWTRGDWQITLWLNNKIKNKSGNKKENPFTVLSKYKIISNIFRSRQEKEILGFIIYIVMLKLIFKFSVWKFVVLALLSIGISTILDFINIVIYKKENVIKTKSFNKVIPGLLASFYRTLLNIAIIPDKAYIAVKAEITTEYRMFKSKKHLLEWETSEDAEKNSKQDIASYYKNMFVNVISGAISLVLAIIFRRNSIFIVLMFLAIIWLAAPTIMYTISKKIKNVKAIDSLNEKDKAFLTDIGYRTWTYFKDNLTKENNFLPPDNYQEDRKPKLMLRTSSTNIGLSLLAVISAYDLKYETLEDTIDLLNNIVNTISNLPKWNGHLYNWYDLKKLEPLIPRYISSVDSGNFVGYLYVILQFLIESKEKIMEINEKQNKLNKIDRSITEEKNVGGEKTILETISMIAILENIIKNTDFSKLYDEKNRLFSVGFNIEDNKLTDSYYDLLASEARQTSFVAIAKKDVSPKHWNNLSRTLTTLDGYKGLISWSGTAFEYLMPNINIPNYKGSILDESCKFLIMSQKAYATKLGVPWGVSEAAFNLKDLYNNYQYKAFGIPWLGLKRGLADEIVVSSYGTILAITDVPQDVMNNIRILEKQGMYSKYGFYESIDYTPSRVKEKYEVVKTYMAHHQGLILLSINNLFNDKILQKRFMENPEMQSAKILLEERMPENMTITKEEKEKVEKIKYIDYEDYNQRNYNKIDPNLNISNVISNDKYNIVMDQYGNGYSTYNGIQINRFKNTDDEEQGIIFFIKDIKNKRIWTNTYSKYLSKPDKYNISYFPDMNKIARTDGCIETVTKVITDTDEPVEIRRLELSNMGIIEQTLEITSYIEPILSTNMQDYSHKAFNNLFISYEYIDSMNVIVVKRNARFAGEKEKFMAVKLYVEGEEQTDVEYEIDKQKFLGRCNLNLPYAVENSIPFSRKIERVTDPIIALKKIVNISPEDTTFVNLIISVSEDKEETIRNIAKFTNVETVKRTFELSKARIEAETRYLEIKGKDIEAYQKMLSYLLFPKKVSSNVANLNINYNVTTLWKYGISGDLPILLVKIKDVNDIDTLKEVVNAYEYYRTKNISIDLVILNEEKENYENYVKDAVQSVVLNKNIGFLFNIKGGIYCLNSINDKKDKDIIEQKASVVINAEDGTLSEQIKDLEVSIKENIKQAGYEEKREYVSNSQRTENYINSSFNEENLKYFNEYGGFSNDGKEYLIRINKNNKLPTVWSHIMTNEHFGTLVTENMGGYTWKENSRLSRITAWSNNQVEDVPSEIIYFKDISTDKKWSLGFNPMADDNDYYITYGFGYAKYLHVSNGIEQYDEVYVPKEDNVKINLIHLENRNLESKNLKLIYYIKPVLGEDELKSNEKINMEFNKKSNMIILKNTENINGEVFIGCSEKIVSYTGSKTSFLQNNNITNPAGLDQLELNRENSYGEDGIVAIEINIKLEAMAGKDVSIILGASNSFGVNDVEENSIQDLAYKYSNINNCKEELIKTKKYWNDLVNIVQVQTPSESTNILLNGWLIYQTINARMLGRTGFYQSGGAYGFRDQLQDSMAVKYFLPNVAREQIIKHAKHQFIEGDVEHWWHEETSRGIRTRFSDDLLWLAYVTADYIEYTQDYSILEENVSYRSGEILKENENERYDLYKESKKIENVYEHCIRAIEKSFSFGENGLPLIGSGDWNDGLSNVGVKGKGESVWLGFFMYDVLRHFIPICEYRNDNEKVSKYKEIMEKLKRALNTNGWDGRWYKRAFMDNGEILGSLQNEECRIDSISQSWAVISDAGDNDKKFISMESLENHLVDKADGIIKLLDPPFEKSKLEPGYIRSYVPGTRENGGQYTHGAIWTIIAMAILNLNDKAFEYFRMINPIEHSRTKEAANKYKVEPYVIAADVYGAGNLTGRGGWTWYTGSSSWMYIAGLKYILGLNIKDGVLKIEPHLPESWDAYSIKFKYGESIYNIKVNKKINEKDNIVVKINENISNSEEIKLDKNGEIYNIEIT